MTINTQLASTIQSMQHHQMSGFTPSFSHQSGGESSARAVRISQPLSVTTTVCSNCALLLPSAVTEVQPSGHITSRKLPALIMGSIVKV